MHPVITESRSHFFSRSRFLNHSLSSCFPLLTISMHKYALTAFAQLGSTLGGLGNTLDGVVSGAPSYAHPAQSYQIVKINGKKVIVPLNGPQRGGGLLDLNGLTGGLGLGGLTGGLGLGRRKRSPVFGMMG
jgi:hypothetical protein